MNEWLDPSIAVAQRALADDHFAQAEMPMHFRAFSEAIKQTRCPGEILDVGCGVGMGREILDRSGVAYASYSGCDISATAIALAKERYPESHWVTSSFTDFNKKADVVADTALLLHVDDWRAHLAALCAASRRFVILHRVPISPSTERTSTHGYGHKFPAWSFSNEELLREMMTHGYRFVDAKMADGDSRTYTFAKPRHFVSYCDRNYLPRLKALHASMVRHCDPFRLHVLAYDDEVSRWCDDQSNVEATAVEDFTAERSDLWRDKLPGPPRTKVEYMWTLGPAMLSATMLKTGEPCTYVDADLMFFSSPEPVFAEVGDYSAAVVPHGFADHGQGLPGPSLQSHWLFGRYNVGWVHCADSRIATWWADRCRQWCYDRVDADAGLYADQRYLENMVHSMGARVIKHPGACPGPWGVHVHALDVRDGVIHFGNRPLVSYHYSAYREGPHGQEQLTRPEYALSDRQADVLYRPYIRALKEAK